MQKTKTKNLAVLILAILATSTISIAILPTTNAHSPSWQLQTYMFVSIAPDPIGVGQAVNVNFWLNLPPPTANVQYGDRWTNLSVVVTHPDGTKETLGPYTSDDTGGAHTRYTPTTTGNYSFQSFFGGQTLEGKNLTPGTTNAFVGDYYQPSESTPFILTVQDEPISYAPIIPLPTEYWTRPIYAQNNDLWYSIGGNWLGLGISTFANTGEYNQMGSYAPYTTAPNSAHILWTKPVAFGGTMGGEFGSDQQSNYWSTSQYQPKFAPIILQGILYYVNYPGSTANPAGWSAVNLHTGQTIWTQNYTTNLRCGQVMNYLSPNEYGGRAYLWATGSVPGVVSTGTTYSMYDAMTGNYILSIVNGSSVSKLLIDDHGGLLGYYTNSSGGKTSITVWNSTRTIMRGENGNGDPNGWQWRPPQNGVLAFQNGIEWSAPINTTYNGNPISLSIAGMTPDVILMTYTSSLSSSFQPGWIIETGYSAKDGHLLWGPLNRTEVVNSRVNMASECMSDDGVWIETDQSALTATGYELSTGNKLWGPTALPNANPYSSLGMRYTTGPNGTILLWTYGGDAYSITARTGKFNFEYHSPSAGYESPYGVWPFWTFQVGTVADGKLFLPVGHMYSPPLFHHALQMAINITDGSVVWNITAFDVTSAPAIADGVMVTLNAYDNQLYAWGKGPTQMTVAAPDFGLPAATPVIIHGTIMDNSAGSNQEAVAANYPNGLPCVSEVSQRLFMESVYMQQPVQSNTTGVPVTIDVMDGNGNYRNIGTTTSDAEGTFSYTWTPDIPGDYKVYAHFDGSESYYPATATTTFHIMEPAATPTQQLAQPASMVDQYFLPAVIAIILTIVIVGAVLLLALRKRP
jgi:hypothetical protein